MYLVCKILFRRCQFQRYYLLLIINYCQMTGGVFKTKILHDIVDIHVLQLIQLIQLQYYNSNGNTTLHTSNIATGHCQLINRSISTICPLQTNKTYN